MPDESTQTNLDVTRTDSAQDRVEEAPKHLLVYRADHVRPIFPGPDSLPKFGPQLNSKLDAVNISMSDYLAHFKYAMRCRAMQVLAIQPMAGGGLMYELQIVDRADSRRAMDVNEANWDAVRALIESGGWEVKVTMAQVTSRQRRSLEQMVTGVVPNGQEEHA